MKRIDLVQQLVKEGMSEKTLVNFSDKQLRMLSERLQVNVDKLKTNPKLQAMAKDPAVNMEVVEKKKELTGKQKNKIDKNHNGKIDAQDFKILNGKKKTEVAEKEEKWIQKAIDPKKKGQLHKDLGVPKDEKIPADKLKSAAKKKGKVGQRARMALNLKNLNEWVDTLVEKSYHPLTTKGDMMEAINNKIKTAAIPMPASKPKKGHNGVAEFMEYNNPEPEKQEPDIETIPAEPDTKPRERPKHPGQRPNDNPDPAPKAKVKQKISPKEAKSKIIGSIHKLFSK